MDANKKNLMRNPLPKCIYIYENCKEESITFGLSLQLYNAQPGFVDDEFQWVAGALVKFKLCNGHQITSF
jgi:hypothetical protein